MIRSRGVIPGLAAAFALMSAAALAPGAARADAAHDGDRAFEAGHLDEAMSFYQKAASQGSAIGEAGVGRVWLRRGQYDKALVAFHAAEKVDPDLAVSYYGEGEILRRQGKYADAVPLLEKATQLNHGFPDAELALGTCLVKTGQFDRGMAEFDHGVRSGGRWAPRFLVARGAAWVSRDSLRQAGIDFTRARELAPDDASVRRAIGDFYIERGTWALAVPELEAAVSLDSTDDDAQYSLARALFFSEQYEQALAVYQHLVDRSPGFAPGQLGLGDLLYRAGAADPRRYAQARPPLETYTRLAPADPKGWSLLGRTAYHLGERDSALRWLVEAQQLGDRDSETYTTLGLAYAGQREWDKALAAFARGKPGPSEYLTVAQVEDYAGHPAQADSIYRLFLARDSLSSRAAFAFTERGRLRYRAKDYGAADTLFARALALDPRDGDAAFFRGLALKELDRWPEALASLRQAAAIDSTHADRFFWLGAVADQQKQMDEAERSFRRCVDLDSTGALAATAFRQLGYYQLLRRDWAGATRDLGRATALDARDAQAWLWLGQGYENSGNRERAAESYRKALALDPSSEPAKKGLASLEAHAPVAAAHGEGHSTADHN